MILVREDTVPSLFSSMYSTSSASVNGSTGSCFLCTMLHPHTFRLSPFFTSGSSLTEYPDFGTMSERMNTSCQPASMILVCSALKCCAAQTASTFVVSMRHGAMNTSSILPATSL